jgi:S1-C subfamily serine protease
MRAPTEAPLSLFPRGTLRLCAVIFLLLLICGCRRDASPLEPVQRMAYEVKPAVVRVSAYATATIRIDPTGSDIGFEELTSGGGTAPVSVETGTGGSGSGFLIHPEGWILTSAHVVEPTLQQEQMHARLLRNGALTLLARILDDDVLAAYRRGGTLDRLIEKVIERSSLEQVEVVNRVELSNGQSASFAVESLSPSIERGGRDLALLRIAGQDLPVLDLADPDGIHLQEQIWIIGYPAVASSEDEQIGAWLSTETDLEPTIHSGSITAIRKSSGQMTIYQSDAPMYPGQSGGPAVNRSGKVVGVPTWGHKSADRIRFLIASEVVAEFIEESGVPLGVEGRFTRLYGAAIDAAAKGDWRQAERNLREADTIFPNSPDLARFLRDAERQLETRGNRHTDLAASVAVAAAVLILLVAGLRLRKPARQLDPGTSVPELVILPRRGDRNDGDALSFQYPGERSLGTFTVLNGERAGQRLGLRGSGIRIGREAKYCEVVLSDPKVSRLHAEVVSLDGRTMLIDHSSSNGTFVNDKRIDRALLRDGDIIYFGGRHAVAVAFRT